MTPEERLRQQQQADDPLANALRRLDDPLDQALAKIGPPSTTSPVRGFAGTIVSAIAPVTEFLSRPQYASAAFFDGMMDKSKSMLDVMSDTFGELIDPKLKMSYSDIIRKRAPEFARNNPKATSVIGFLGDVALDPTSYLGVGLAGKGIKVGGKVLTEAGVALRTSMIEKLTGKEIITAIDTGIKTELFKAGQKGVEATVKTLKPGDIARDVINISREFGDELQAIGVDVSKENLRKIAFRELGIESIPKPRIIVPNPFRTKDAGRVVEDAVDDIASELEKAIKKGSDLPMPTAPASGTRVSGGYSVPGKVTTEQVLEPVRYGSSTTTYKLRDVDKYTPYKPSGGKKVSELKRLPKGSEVYSPPGGLEGRFPINEDVKRYASQVVEQKVAQIKPGLKNATPEQIDKLKDVIKGHVDTYVDGVNLAITEGKSIRTVKTQFMNKLNKRINSSLKDAFPEKPVPPTTPFLMTDDLPFERLMPPPGGIHLPQGKVPFTGVEYSQGVVRKLAVEEVTEKVEERISRLVNLDPVSAKALLKEPKITINANIPFTKMNVELLNLTGIAPLKRSIEFVSKLNDLVISKNIPVISQTAAFARNSARFGAAAVTGVKEIAAGMFVRPQDEPFRKIIKQLENSLDYTEGQVLRETKRLFDGMNDERRETLTQILRDIDDKTRMVELTENRVMTQGEADSIFQEAIQNAKVKLDKPGVLTGKTDLGITNQEMSILAGLKHEYATVASLEMEANLLKTEIRNYHPRYYDSIEDPKDMIAITQFKYGLSTELTSSQSRKYITSQEAVAAGLIPEMDAAMIYATRVTASRRALAKKQFFDNLGEAFGMDIKSQNDLTKLLGLPNGRRYLNDIKLLGESVYPTGMNTTTKAFMKVMDTFTGMYRFGATVLKPSFAPKQAVSNTAQMMLELGLKGGKTFDPRAMTDAVMLLFDFYRGAKPGKLPPTVGNFINKFIGKGEQGADAVMAGRLAMSNLLGEEQLMDVAKEFKLINAFGTQYSGEDLVRIMRENNVIRGVDAVGNNFKLGLKKYLDYNPNNRKDLSMELIKFWKYPSMTEDYARAVSFMSFLRQGHSPVQATNEVNKVLFDYSRGLTNFEQTVMRRIFPFYTFQRFAIPFVMKKIVEAPGTVAAANKITGLMEKLLVSPEDTLNPSEREIFGDSFYIEQPRIFSGFDKDGGAKFNILNNMTPLDALSLFVYDKKGNMDYQRTIEKTVLAAITPFLKVELEWALNKNFFTGRVVDEGQKLGNLKDTVSAVLPDFAKEAIGWEDRVNLRTGKTSTYINSFLGYRMLSYIPALKQFINLGDEDKSALDKSMEIITGVVPKNVDLKELKDWQNISNTTKIRDFVSEIRMAKAKGANTEYEKSLAEYRDFLNVIKDGNLIKNQYETRGLGISGQRSQALDQEQR